MRFNAGHTHLLTRRPFVSHDRHVARAVINRVDTDYCLLPINYLHLLTFSSISRLGMAPTVSDEKFVEGLYTAVAQIFEEAQSSLANHKKNCVALYKVHTKAATITTNGAKKKFAGEKAFQEVFMDMLGRVLDVKKGPANADRVIKYAGSFVTFLVEKGESNSTYSKVFQCSQYRIRQVGLS